jgi:hypothetical protein
LFGTNRKKTTAKKEEEDQNYVLPLVQALAYRSKKEMVFDRAWPFLLCC